MDIFSNLLASKFADYHKMFTIAGSDSRVCSTVGRCINAIESENNIDSVINNLLNGRSKFQSANYATKKKEFYVLYPNGTVDTHVTCSNNPFKLETEIDRSRIIAFFGQVRDRLIILLRDECDINKDIKIGHLLHFSAIKVQIKYLDHLFRIYIKSMGKETVSRVEESQHQKKSAIETINYIFNPMEKVEKQIASLNTKISTVYDIVSKLSMTTVCGVVN